MSWREQSYLKLSSFDSTSVFQFIYTITLNVRNDYLAPKPYREYPNFWTKCTVSKGHYDPLNILVNYILRPIILINIKAIGPTKSEELHSQSDAGGRTNRRTNRQAKKLYPLKLLYAGKKLYPLKLLYAGIKTNIDILLSEHDMFLK